jgi:hypothetical protein
MTNQQHPITPPTELVQQWLNADAEKGLFAEPLAAKAAQWGADQELEACCADIRTVYGRTIADWLRSLRRSKPPSLKEQALTRTAAILNDPNRALLVEERETLELALRALEQLND